MIDDTSLLLIHAAATLAMTGVIWFVQLVHYPLFQFAARPSFSSFALEHQRRTSWIVAPLMLVEAATAVLLLVQQVGPWTIAGAVLLALIWLSTALLQMPAHRRLGRGFEPDTARSLVRGNWLRTLAWTGRAVVALALL